MKTVCAVGALLCGPASHGRSLPRSQTLGKLPDEEAARWAGTGHYHAAGKARHDVGRRE